SYTHRYNLIQQSYSDNFITTLAFPTRYHAGLERNQMRAAWDLAPKWGQNIHLYYEHMPFKPDDNGHIFAVTSTFYFPGIFHNHSFQFRFNYQESSGIFRYSSIIPRVSGYSRLRPSRPSNTIMLDYALPLAYPDFELGTLAYLRRISATMFADFQDVSTDHLQKPR